MPNCNFYATDKDYQQILNFIFKELDCKVYQKYSEPNRDMVQFKNTAEVVKHYHLDQFSSPDGKAQTAHLVLWPIKASNNFKVTRQELNPKKYDGASFRQHAEGWGAIQVTLTGAGSKGLEMSSCNHSTQKRAKAWEVKRKNDLGLASAWNWNVVDSAAGALSNFIKHRAETKNGAIAVLPAASKMNLIK